MLKRGFWEFQGRPLVFQFSKRGTLVLKQLKEEKNETVLFSSLFLRHCGSLLPIYGTSFLQGCHSASHELDGNKMGEKCKWFARKGGGRINFQEAIKCKRNDFEERLI